MKFGPVPTREALGAILAHSVLAADPSVPESLTYKIPKGTALTEKHIRDLLALDVTAVTVARLEGTDIHEDEAATQLAASLLNERAELSATRAKTGRVNLRAETAGLVDLDAGAINAANSVHPGITIATVPQLQRLELRGLAATVKIIPYGVPKDALQRAVDLAENAMGFLPPQITSATLIETSVAGLDHGPKGREAIRHRLARLGVMLSDKITIPHTIQKIADALTEAPGELLLILTGSATSDEADTAPAALVQAGGEILHYGMPVDPGNLLFIGKLGPRYVIGLPGCARSPALNGADWVLERVICGRAPSAQDIMGMGVGGLLKEIPSRPLPRIKAEKA